MSHDADLVAKVAEAISTHAGLSRAAQEDAARAVLDALDVPGRERRTTARFRAAVELTVQDVRAQRGDHIAGLVEDSFDAHFARAAELDPEEGDDGRV